MDWLINFLSEHSASLFLGFGIGFLLGLLKIGKLFGPKVKLFVVLLSLAMIGISLYLCFVCGKEIHLLW